MHYFTRFLWSLFVSLAIELAHAQPTGATTPAERPLRELYKDYFPLQHDGPITVETWGRKKQEVRERILLASGLWPLPTKTPLNAVVHGRVERDDYTIDRVFFESFPGHYVTGSLYLPKNLPPGKRMPGILSAHGHWPQGRFMDLGADSREMREQLAIGAERFESGARAPLQARCVQLARMGCAVFFFDTLGNADSIQIPEHRSGRRPHLNGAEPGTFGLYSAMADLRLQSNFGLQTWNSVRALDFLLTVPGVDPTRISATGASGGATQTMMLAAIDDRLATAFPCVMVSTAMQGGCTCENAHYLRIGQGNIDIAAAFAPKPLGLTAADDWTKELATKGYPELKQVWQALGQPGNIMATFNTHWKHNYNHVSRTTMYGFMNQHFKLGYKEPVLEREFVVLSREEATVWTAAHPKPAGEKVGEAHERALLKYWSEDSDRLVAAQPEAAKRAWRLIVGRDLPQRGELQVTAAAAEKAGFKLSQMTLRHSKYQENVSCALLTPVAGRWNGNVVLWLNRRGYDEFADESGAAWVAARTLLDAGFAVACPRLYLADATEQPMNPVNSKDQSRNEWRWAAAYTYGYNPPLVVRRVHDAMATVAMIQAHPELKSARIVVMASPEAAPVAAITATVFSSTLAGAVVDTGGFRFASLNDPWHPLFVPGAVKYGDLPGLLRLADSLKPVVLGEKGIAGGPNALAASVLQLKGAKADAGR